MVQPSFHSLFSALDGDMVMVVGMAVGGAIAVVLAVGGAVAVVDGDPHPPSGAVVPAGALGHVPHQDSVVQPVDKKKRLIFDFSL